MEKLNEIKLFLNEHKFYVLVALAILILLLGGGFLYFLNIKETNSLDSKIELEKENTKDEKLKEEIPSQECTVMVDVKEEVKKKEEKCENQTIIKNNACVTSEKIVVEDNSTSSSSNTKISLNHATKEELLTLTGIGESKANLIMEYRNQNGGFKTIEEIKNVKGIGDKMFEKIKDNITI